MKNINTQELIDNIECTGCSCCMNVCPANAIEMIYNNEGFKYPEIEPTLCIGCKSCIHNCPIRNDNINTYPLESYSCYAKSKETVLQGSSGGIIPVIYEYVKSNNGVLYGAVFNKNTKCIEHCSSIKTDVSNIFRSKYVQSDINYCYREVKQFLDEHKLVIFTGTPCQIAGLKAFLKKDYRNLLTVDFICHGVPSPGVFQNFIKKYENKENSKIENISFREKDNGWICQTIKVYFNNNRVYKIRSKRSIFYNLFIFNFILRKSCYECKYSAHHLSDIVLADNWTSSDNPYGVSKVIINTKKGLSAFNEIIDKIEYKKEMSNMKMNSRSYPKTYRNFFYKFYNYQNSNNNLYVISFILCTIIRLKKKFIFLIKNGGNYE